MAGLVNSHVLTLTHTITCTCVYFVTRHDIAVQARERPRHRHRDSNREYGAAIGGQGTMADPSKNSPDSGKQQEKTNEPKLGELTYFSEHNH